MARIKGFHKIKIGTKNVPDTKKDDIDLCGNCQAVLRKDAKYCTICGTERGQGSFEAVHNVQPLVYGPPVRELFTCQKCGKKWELNCLGRSKTSFCPECGASELDMKRKRGF